MATLGTLLEPFFWRATLAYRTIKDIFADLPIFEFWEPNGRPALRSLLKHGGPGGIQTSREAFFLRCPVVVKRCDNVKEFVGFSGFLFCSHLYLLP